MVVTPTVGGSTSPRTTSSLDLHHLDFLPTPTRNLRNGQLLGGIDTGKIQQMDVVELPVLCIATPCQLTTRWLHLQANGRHLLPLNTCCWYSNNTPTSPISASPWLLLKVSTFVHRNGKIGGNFLRSGIEPCIEIVHAAPGPLVETGQ